MTHRTRALGLFSAIIVGCSAQGPSRAPGSPSPPEGRSAPAGPEPAASPAPALEFRRPRPEVVQAMLLISGLDRGATAYLLGCGDGGIAALAARDRGARVIAVDPRAEAIAPARENVRRAGVESLVEFRQEDLLATGMEGADVVFLYLDPMRAKKLEPQLRERLRPGTLVVSCVPAFAEIGEQEGENGAIHFYRVPSGTHPDSLAPFVPSPMPVVHKMLEMAKLSKEDVVYDLGCGDGRIVVEAAKRHGVRGVGIDFDSRRIVEAQERARREGVEGLVEFRRQDIREADFSDASVVMVYLLPISADSLKPKFDALRPGTRIVSHQFEIVEGPPDRSEVVTTEDGYSHAIHLWEVEGEAAGTAPDIRR